MLEQRRQSVHAGNPFFVLLLDFVFHFVFMHHIFLFVRLQGASASALTDADERLQHRAT
jgi:hypothetical protein